MLRLLSTLTLWLAGALAVHAGIKTEVIEYQHGDKTLEGYLAYDDSVQEKRPGVLIVHEWWGHNPYVRKRAEQLAASGYVAFALDMYGKGVLAKNAQDAAALAGQFKSDPQLLRGRAGAGLAVLQKHPAVDPRRLAAIGYCFGGTVVLELARGGVDLAGVVSFHGGLKTQNPADAKTMKARVLVLHGADDPLVPESEVAAFAKEMRDAKVDWQMVSYGGAVHSFTNPDAGNDPKSGVAYDERADRRSFFAMLVFFNEIFDGKK